MPLEKKIQPRYTLLASFKSSVYQQKLPLHYVGKRFNKFVVGYGLDYKN